MMASGVVQEEKRGLSAFFSVSKNRIFVGLLSH
jgi:hypothetical protein